MTLYPEIALAAELGIDMVALCVVTDFDSGESAEDAVTAEAVFAGSPRRDPDSSRRSSGSPHPSPPNTSVAS